MEHSWAGNNPGGLRRRNSSRFLINNCLCTSRASCQRCTGVCLSSLQHLHQQTFEKRKKKTANLLCCELLIGAQSNKYWEVQMMCSVLFSNVCLSLEWKIRISEKNKPYQSHSGGLVHSVLTLWSSVKPLSSDGYSRCRTHWPRLVAQRMFFLDPRQPQFITEVLRSRDGHSTLMLNCLTNYISPQNLLTAVLLMATGGTAQLVTTESLEYVQN